jgi:drug/metabolite transporter superfamily protein YnfA
VYSSRNFRESQSVLIVLSVLWGWALDRIAPDRFDPSAARSASPASA